MAVFRYSRTMRSNTFMATEVSATGRLPHVDTLPRRPRCAVALRQKEDGQAQEGSRGREE